MVHVDVVGRKRETESDHVDVHPMEKSTQRLNHAHGRCQDQWSVRKVAFHCLRNYLLDARESQTHFDVWPRRNPVFGREGGSDTDGWRGKERKGNCRGWVEGGLSEERKNDKGNGKVVVGMEKWQKQRGKWEVGRGKEDVGMVN